MTCLVKFEVVTHVLEVVWEWSISMWLWVKTKGIPFWGRCTIRGDWEVHWGYGILRDFDPYGHVG